MSAAGVPTYLMAVTGIRLIARSRAAAETDDAAGAVPTDESVGPEA
jgi:hypothetical protein